MTDRGAQRLRRLPGRFTPELLPEGSPAPSGGWLALVRAPDGLTVLRAAADDEEAWLALFSGGTPHPPEATGMLASLLVPLADAGLPVVVASSHEGDVILVPERRIAEAEQALRAAGHTVEA